MKSKVIWIKEDFYMRMIKALAVFYMLFKRVRNTEKKTAKL